MLIAKSQNGFTLAETLITLGIIGVVAALTIPTLISKYQEKVLVNLAKKNYSIVMNALNMYNTDNDSLGNYSTLMDYSKSDIEIMTDFIKYFNGAQPCYQGQKAVCDLSYKIRYAKPVNNGQGKNAFFAYPNVHSTILLTDGSFLAIRRDTTQAGDCGFSWTSNVSDENGNYIKNDDGSYKTTQHTSTRCGRITVDTNGAKGPNRVGSDVFTYQVLTNKVFFSTEEGNLNYILQHNKVQPYQNYNEGDFNK